MRIGGVLIILFSVLPCVSHGMDPVLTRPSFKTAFYFHQYIQTDPGTVRYEHQLQKFISKLESKRASYRSEKDFLRHVFFKTHQRYLKNYQSSTPFRKIFENGTYDCLTGTALYALILDHLDFKFSIIETNHHIFILTQLQGEEILLEATDPQTGFVAEARAVAERLDSYRGNQRAPDQVAPDQVLYTFHSALYNEVDLRELAGLMYYNQAIRAYNSRHLEQALFYLEAALNNYHSSRIDEFFSIIVVTVRESSVSDEEKENAIRRIQSVQRKRSLILARQG